MGPDGIRARQGSETDVPLAWDDIHSVTHRKHVAQDRQPLVTIGADGGATLHLRIQQETNVEIRLERPVPIRLPHGPETVTAVHLYADDPRAFLAEVRRHLTGTPA